MAKTLQTLWIIALTDFKLRYSNSILGYLWSLLKPLLIFLVLYIVFTVLVRLNIKNYQLILLLGIILWNFFAESTSVGMNSMLAKSSLITKVKFPRWILVVASTLSSFMTLLLNLVVFGIFLYFSNIQLSWPAILAPLYIIELYMLVLGLSLGLSVMQVRYRDIAQVWEVVLQAGFFLSPIAYSLDVVPPQYHAYMFLNPITPIVQYLREVLINGNWTSLEGNLAATVMVGIIFAAGAVIFRRLEPSIAESL